MSFAPAPSPTHDYRLPEPFETVQGTLEALALKQPGAPAIHVPGRATLTYAQLGRQIRYVRERLQGWNVQPGDVVAAGFASRPELALAIATMPASCTFAPLDASLPTEAYAMLLARMRAKAILAMSADAHPIRVAARRLGIAEIDLVARPDEAAGLFALELSRSTPALAARPLGDARWAYILTTSGTTGRRKLVPALHRVDIHYSHALREWFGFTPHDVSVHFMPATSAHGVRSGLVNPLLAGASIVLLGEGDVDAFYGSIERFQPSFVTCSFSLLREVLRRAPAHREAIARHHLRFMRSGSGHLALDVADQLEQLFAIPVLTGLSSTETCRIAAEPLPPRTRKRGSVGLPMVNEVALLDGKTIRHGEGTGEILVRGPLVFPGYVDDADLTAASFLGDWFRTGDLGHVDSDGYIHVTGRLKEIINRGGEKISPVEIDAAIESLPGVKEAAAFGVPHPTLGEEMVAAVVREAGARVDATQVAEQVRARAGDRRVPRRVFFVENLPRDASGKLRRGALADLVAADAHDAPRAMRARRLGPELSPLESALAGLWSSLLHVDHVGRDDDFFLLGGDSLQGMQLIGQVKSLFGVHLPLQALFGEMATVGGLAQAIERIRAAQPARDSPTDHDPGHAAIVRVPRQARASAPVSHAQWRMWFLAQFDAGGHAYHVIAAYRLQGSIDVAALRQALLDVLGRHEALRTTYALVDDEPRQLVHERPQLDFDVVDLGAQPPADRHRALMSAIDAEERAPFDLETGPLLRFRLMRIADDEHVLVRVWHHIVTDGWSAMIFDRELSGAYNARAVGEERSLPPLAFQYVDYAAWQRAWLAGPERDRQLHYWREALTGLQPLELPTDYRRPTTQSHRGARVDRLLPPELLGRLSAFARVEGATLFMVVTAAFAVLLHRHSGAEDIAVGTPIAGRRREEFAGVMGVFLNMLVLRANIAGRPSWREVLARVRATALAAYEHQDLPFETLVEELAPGRDASRNPLFQVCCAMQFAEPTLALHGVGASAVEPPRLSAKFDLTLMIREVDDGLLLTWEYCTDLFERGTIERWGSHLATLLESMVSDPDAIVTDVPVMTDAERRKLLIEWNDTDSETADDLGVHQLIEAEAARSPAALAIVCKHGSTTYGELNARANRLARHLVDLGIDRGARVAVCVERSVHLVTAWLAVLKAGAAYVAIDPSYPLARIEAILEDIEAGAVLTMPDIARRLPRQAAPVVDISEHPTGAAARPANDLARRAGPDDLAYVCYTSGSTGRPNGVAIAHRSLSNLVRWHCEAYSVTGADRASQVSAPGFDAAGWEIWPYLCAGASVHFADEHVRVHAAALVQWLASSGITLAFVPTALAEAALRERWPEACALRALLTGGDRLKVRPAAETKFRVVNHYGPTENCVVSTCAGVTALDDGRRSLAIGRPLPNTRAYVLDARSQPVPIGVAGELVVGGVQVARGYWNRPELTAARFVPDPFARRPGARMYRTGDRVRILGDGNIEFLGRLDEQIKLRGYRIEPAEVEAALAAHPSVREAAVVAHDDAGETRLVAYIVPADGDTFTVDALRSTARERLPDYMHPVDYVLLKRLPQGSHGKVDRRTLRFAERLELRRPQERDAGPRNALEAAMVEIWREVLRRELIGVNDNFFELGGHSLLAAQVIGRLAKRFDVRVPLRLIFEAPTIAGLAQAMQDSRALAESELARILSEVETLTDEQAALQLRHAAGPRAGGAVPSGES